MMFNRVFPFSLKAMPANAVSLGKINLAGQSSCGAVLPFIFYSVSFFIFVIFNELPTLHKGIVVVHANVHKTCNK